jgi:hypothetical protein
MTAHLTVLRGPPTPQALMGAARLILLRLEPEVKLLGELVNRRTTRERQWSNTVSAFMNSVTSSVVTSSWLS